MPTHEGVESRRIKSGARAKARWVCGAPPLGVALLRPIGRQNGCLGRVNWSAAWRGAQWSGCRERYRPCRASWSSMGCCGWSAMLQRFAEEALGEAFEEVAPLGRVQHKWLRTDLWSHHPLQACWSTLSKQDALLPFVSSSQRSSSRLGALIALSLAPSNSSTTSSSASRPLLCVVVVFFVRVLAPDTLCDRIRQVLSFFFLFNCSQPLSIYIFHLVAIIGQLI